MLQHCEIARVAAIRAGPEMPGSEWLCGCSPAGPPDVLRAGVAAGQQGVLRQFDNTGFSCGDTLERGPILSVGRPAALLCDARAASCIERLICVRASHNRVAN
jgi:hypothetical protein